jgi:hypothetical protein
MIQLVKMRVRTIYIAKFYRTPTMMNFHFILFLKWQKEILLNKQGLSKVKNMHNNPMKMQ